jgi:hypothetical protein
MLQPTIKPKRGVTKYHHPEYGEVWYNNTRKDGMIVICDTPRFQLEDNYYDVHPETLQQIGKQRTGLNTTVKKPSPEEVKFKLDLNVFFASQILVMPFLCDNCKQPLHAFTAFEKRCCIAHILEKKKFTTVAVHPQNKLFLCAKGGCHHKYDNSTAKERSEMNIYPLAVERYNNFKELLTEAEIVKAEKYLNII